MTQCDSRTDQQPCPSQGPDFASHSQAERYEVYAIAAERIEQALDQGRDPDIQDLLTDHPQFADELTQLVGTLKQLHVADGVSNGSMEADLLDSFGDFKILREIGRGGMGVVYEARQLSLGRRVALKVLPYASVLSPRRLQRFKNEAMAAASLQHPHIVPVFAVGCDHNVHFYAMQLIDGRSLAQEVQETRDLQATLVSDLEHGSEAARMQEAFRRTAALAIDVARALHHAHERGIVHRDIKPSNLLRDKEGKVWVADFGLARIEADANLTASGDLMGTLRYMSPEQASGGVGLVDQRSDIYSLGATIYELLTLQPAFPGQDRAELLQAVLSETSTPAPIRRLSPSAPRDLQTIVMTALAKEPEERYRTAEQMADDLQRFLDHKPIVARPASIVERLTKWLRRHRAIAGLAFVSLLVMTLVLAMTSVRILHEQTRTAAALKRVERLASEAVVLRYRAEETARQARASAEQERWQSELSQTLLYASDMNRAHQAAQDGDLPQLMRLLNRHQPVDGRSDVRGFEWNWLLGRAIQPRRTLAELDAGVYCVRCSHDGRRIAYAGAGGVIYLHELPNRRLVTTIETGQKEVNGLSFSPDDVLLASAGDDGSACLWNVADGKRVRRFNASDELLFGAAFTPDGSLLATCGRDPVIRLWDVRAGLPAGRLGTNEGDGHKRTVEAIAISNDGRWLASISGDRRVFVWDLALRTCTRKLETGKKTGLCVAFSPDGRQMATGNEDGTVLVWDPESGATIAQARHLDSVHSVRFAPNDEGLVVGDRAGVLRWWDLAPDEESLLSSAAAPTPARLIAGWQAHQGRISDLAFEPGAGWLISTGDDGDVASWRRPLSLRADSSWSRSEVIDFALFPGGDQFALVSKSTLMVVRGASGKVLRSRVIDGERFSSVAVSPDGRQLAAGLSGGRIGILDSRSLNTQREWLVCRNATVRRLSFAGNGRSLACTPRVLGDDNVDKSLGLWRFDVPTGAAFGEPLRSPSDYRFSPNPDLLALKVLDQVQLLKAGTGEQIGRLADHESLATMAFSPDGRVLATGSAGRTVKLWDVASQRELATLEGHTGGVTAVCFSPDGRTLVTAGDFRDRAIRLWNVATGQMLFVLHHTSDGVSKMAFSPKGRYLAFLLRNGQFHLFDLSTGRSLDDSYR